MRVRTILVVAVGLLLVVGCQAKKPNEVPPLAAEELQPPLPVESAPVAVTEVETTKGSESKAPPAPSAGSSGNPATYTVQKGEGLMSIARKFYGDPAMYKRIFEANRDKLKDPNVVPVGTVLVIPPK